MRLRKVDFYLDWSESIKTIDLRRFISENLNKKGRVIRWSILDIKASVESPKIKKIRIYAVLAHPTTT